VDRVSNPRGTGDRLHGELVEAAVRVLAAHGDTERLSIRAVAAEAQVTPTAVYRCSPTGGRSYTPRGDLLRPL
jgi:DNA-binding transcriptional regulator YbjK